MHFEGGGICEKFSVVRAGEINAKGVDETESACGDEAVHGVEMR